MYTRFRVTVSAQFNSTRNYVRSCITMQCPRLSTRYNLLLQVMIKTSFRGLQFQLGIVSKVKSHILVHRKLTYRGA